MNDPMVKQKLLANRQLREQKVLSASENQALYALTNQQQLERDRLRVDPMSQTLSRTALAKQHQDQTATLKKELTQQRLALQARHASEQARLKQWLAKQEEPC